MTKKTNNLSASLRQKIQNIIHQEDGFSFIEVIIVIAMILILSAILIPSYLGFVETAREANAKISAQNMYTAVQVAMLSVDDPDDNEEFYLKLKDLNPALIGINAIETEDATEHYVSAWHDDMQIEINPEQPEIDPVEIVDFTDNTCVVSRIETDDNGYSFEYYQYFNETVYFIEFENGSIVGTDTFKNVPPSNPFGD